MSLKEQLTIIEKRFGKGSLIRLGDTENVPVEVISTGIPSLDIALGVGGFPKGRITELVGEEATGKSSLTMSTIGQAQKLGGLCAIVDAEHAIDRNHAAKLGVDVDALYVSQPSCGEEALEITEALIKSGEMAIVVVDSVAALVPRNELDGDFGDAQMGLQARMMSQAMRKLTALVHKSNCCLIFVNQYRSKIGVVFGSPLVTTGGKALKFYSSVRCELSRIGQLKDGEEVIGVRTRVKILKNKVSAPAKVAEFDLLFDRGFSKSGDLIDLAVERSIVERSGAWYIVAGEKLQGRSNAVEFLEQNPAIAVALEKEIREGSCVAM